MTTEFNDLPCLCPICGWTGFLWAFVASGPSRYIRKLCPKCGSYPRDRLVWCHLRYLSESTKAIQIIEVGGAPRTYWWKKRLYGYQNADIKEQIGETVDLLVENGRIQNRPSDNDIAIISHVLGEISSKRVRMRLLAELWAATKGAGVLIMFDDFDPGALHHHNLSPRLFFHKLRLGRPILAELKESGWFPSIVDGVPKNPILAESDVPFIVAHKEQVNDLKTRLCDAIGAAPAR